MSAEGARGAAGGASIPPGNPRQADGGSGISQLGRNVIANYVSQSYVALIGIALTPVYLAYMGPEAYGLVGFYAMLQSWFFLLDLGMTPTMSRETARLRGGAGGGLALRRLLRTLEGIFAGVGLLGAAAMIAASGRIAADWLNVHDLPLEEVQRCLMLIGVIVALRWVGELYRGVLVGLEDLVWVGAFNIGIATVRFVFVVPLFALVGVRPTVFFSYQLALSVLEFAALARRAYRRLPAAEDQGKIIGSWRSLRSVLHFSLAVALTGAVWGVATQTDKLLLSRILSLREYGYFSLAVLVAGGVMAVSGPVSGALMPRLVALHAEGREPALLLLYRRATQLTMVMVLPATLVLAMFSEQVISVWTGDPGVARQSAALLTLYAAGNGLMAIGAFPYYLQYARGDLRLHLAGSAAFLMILIPALLWGTSRLGAIGAGYAWLGANVSYLLLWVPIVHRRFAPGLHRLWLLQDLGPAAAAGLVAATALHYLVHWPVGRVSSGLLLVAIGLGLMAACGLVSGWVRDAAVSLWRSAAHGPSP